MSQQNNGSENFANNAQNFANQMNATPDFTNQIDPQDTANNKGMAILSYFGPLVLIPIFAAKDSRFARFHANQGLVLLIAEIILGVVLGIVTAIIGWIPIIGGIVSSLLSAVVGIISVVFWVLGIVNAAQGKAKQLPIIGGITLLN